MYHKKLDDDSLLGILFSITHDINVMDHMF